MPPSSLLAPPAAPYTRLSPGFAPATGPRCAAPAWRRHEPGYRRGVPSLSPAIAEVRRAVRASLSALPAGSTVIVALSGGPDSLALAAATAFEAPKLGLRAASVTVDHGLQPGSDEVALTAARAAAGLGLDPLVVRVEVGTAGGPRSGCRRWQGNKPISGDRCR